MAGSRTSTVIELLVRVDRGDARSLHHQLEQQLRDAIREARLGAGTTMPSSRALAAELGVARGVVVEAYEQLIAEGYLASRPGGSTRVSDVAAGPAHRPRAQAAATARIDLRPGRPDVAEFPRAAWSRAMRRVLNEAPSDRLSYLDGRGVPELRTALAAYLDRVRGTAIHPDSVVVSTGFMQGLHLSARALARAGARRLAVEEPYDPSYRQAVTDSGLEVVPVPVDEAGLRVDALATVQADGVLVTPAHQFPTGGVLAPERRAELIAWAREHDATIIEDDYDAEFRYDRDPIGAMQGLDPDHVIYAGTASKSLAPGLRLGWLAAPARLIEPLTESKNAFDHGSGALDQLALAEVIERGELDRHLRHMRAIYRERRDTTLASLARYLPTWEAVGASAGLHVLARLPVETDEAAIVEGAAGQGILLYGLDRYRAVPSAGGGIVFGYAGADSARIDEALRVIASLPTLRAA